MNLTFVVSTPGICGGQPRIAGTRIPVWTLAAYWSQNVSDSELLRFFPHLNAGQIRAAKDYYLAHRRKIDQAVREQASDEIA